MPDNSAKFNADLHLDIPEWINSEYFGKILRKDFPCFKKILKFTIIPASPPGENYTSIMMRVKMDFEMEDGFTQQKSYIMKTMLDNGRKGNYVNTLNLFPKEKLMYENVLPQLEALYEERGSKVKFAPRCHWIEDNSGQITLVLADLKTKKFRNINRLKGFDMLHIKKVLEKLAEFHAASAVLKERKGSIPQEFQNIYLPINYHKSKSYQARIRSYKSAMSLWGLEDYEKYSSFIPSAEQYMRATMHCHRGDPSEFKVLNHGDFWSSNIMLNYLSNATNANADINQIRFVDFQMCKWSNPALDLWELIICSVESNLRIRHFDYFLRIYHNHLQKCLAFLHYPKPLPLLRDLHISMLRYGFWAYYNTFNHLVLILMPDKEASLLRLMQCGEEGEKFRMKAYTNPLYVRAVLDIFPFLYRKGLLDFT